MTSFVVLVSCLAVASCVRHRYDRLRSMGKSIGAHAHVSPDTLKWTADQGFSNNTGKSNSNGASNDTDARDAKVKEILLKVNEVLFDYNTALFHLTKSFLFGQSDKIVMVGYDGSGVIETFNRAMTLATEHAHKLIDIKCDLKKWYLSTFRGRERAGVMEAYGTLKQKELQLSKLLQNKEIIQKEYQTKIKKAAPYASKLIVSIDGAAFAGLHSESAEDEWLKSMQTFREWLKIVHRAIGDMDVIQVVVLHPGPSTDIRTKAVLRAAGFPDSQWIDFSVVHTQAEQEQIARVILPEPCSDAKNDDGHTLAEYFYGSPGANSVFFLNKNKVMQRVWSLAGQHSEDACYDALKVAEELAVSAVGGKYIEAATPMQKQAISNMLELSILQEVRSDEWQKWQDVDMPGAASCGAITKLKDSSFIMSPLQHDALTQYLLRQPIKMLPPSSFPSQPNEETSQRNNGHPSCGRLSRSVLLLLICAMGVFSP